MAAAVLAGQPSPVAPTPAIQVGLALANGPTSPPVLTPAPAPPFDAESFGRPVYAVGGHAPSSVEASSSPFRIHVVHDGDTLERLAERYLSDGSRALELFDLNRDVLENPHLLAIGVELRIPTVESEARD
jgi:nucleoid-associated protein YgaU